MIRVLFKVYFLVHCSTGKIFSLWNGSLLLLLKYGDNQRQQKGQFWSPSVSNLSTLYLLWSLSNSMYYKME